MIVEQERVERERNKLIEERKFLRQVIQSGEKYERLVNNSDFNGYVKDVQVRIDAHDANIKGYIGQMSSCASPFKRMRLADLIQQHQIRKEECETLIQFPESTRSAKEEALQRLETIDKLEKEINHVR